MLTPGFYKYLVTTSESTQDVLCIQKTHCGKHLPFLCVTLIQWSGWSQCWRSQMENQTSLLSLWFTCTFLVSCTFSVTVSTSCWRPCTWKYLFHVISHTSLKTSVSNCWPVVVYLTRDCCDMEMKILYQKKKEKYLSFLFLSVEIKNVLRFECTDLSLNDAMMMMGYCSKYTYWVQCDILAWQWHISLRKVTLSWRTVKESIGSEKASVE